MNTKLPKWATTLSVKADGLIIPFRSICYIDTTQIEELIVSVHLYDGSIRKAHDLDAIELVMQLKPSALEGRRLRYAKHMWIIHNWFGHPLMQVLAFFKCHKLAFWVHDATVPKPASSKITRVS